MSEQFDAELGKAFKESAARSLEGWEFTPAMQQSVLERIERAATGTVPAARPSRRFEPGRAIRPLAWTAVAAATLLVVVNTQIGQRGAIKKNGPDMGVAGRAPASPNASSPGSDAKGTAPPATADATKPAGGSEGAGSGATPPAQQPGPTAQPGNTVPTPQSSPESQKQVAEGGPRAQAKQPEQPQLSAAPEGDRPAAAREHNVPASPQHMGIAGMPNEPVGTSEAASTSHDGTGSVALEAPPAANAKSAAPMGIMAATQDHLHVQAAGGAVVELTRSAVRSLTADGTPAWAYPLAGASDDSLLAVSGDGFIAVTVADRVHVLDPQGHLLRTLQSAGSVTALAWAPDGRLAVAAGTGVTVTRPQSGATEFQTAAISRPELAFGPDGILAVFGQTDSGRQLFLYDQGGALKGRAAQGRSGARGLAFSASGVVAGTQAYGLTGDPLWQAPFAPAGLTPLAGTDLIVAHKADAVVALRSADGAPVWEAAWSGKGGGIQRVVTAPDGRFLAVLGSTDQGAVLWVLDQNGQVVHTERVSEEPSDIAFVGDRLLLLTGQGAEFRAFQQTR